MQTINCFAYGEGHTWHLVFDATSLYTLKRKISVHLLRPWKFSEKSEIKSLNKRERKVKTVKCLEGNNKLYGEGSLADCLNNAPLSFASIF